MSAKASLRQFMIRSKSLLLYRQFVRASRRLPPAEGSEIMILVKHQFRCSCMDDDEFSMESAHTEGKIQLARLHDMISSLARTSPNKRSQEPAAD